MIRQIAIAALGVSVSGALEQPAASPPKFDAFEVEVGVAGPVRYG